MKNKSLLKDKYILSSLIVLLPLLFYLLLFDVIIPENIAEDIKENCCSTHFLLALLWLAGLFVWLALGSLIIIRLFLLKPVRSELQNIAYLIIVIATVYYSSVGQLKSDLDEFQHSIDLIHNDNKQKLNNDTSSLNYLTSLKNYSSIAYDILIAILIIWITLILITLILTARKKP